jgi:hypothetical protein
MNIIKMLVPSPNVFAARLSHTILTSKFTLNSKKHNIISAMCCVEYVIKAAVRYSLDASTTCVSETISLHDYTASANFIVYFSVTELQMFYFPEFFLVHSIP